MIIQHSPSKPTSLSTTTPPFFLTHHFPLFNKLVQNEKQEEMGDSPQQINPFHSPSTHFQIYPTTPEKSTCYSPISNHVKQTQNNNCFKCHQPGHWASVCPLKSPNNNSNKSLFTSPVSVSERIQCRCGHGFCDVKTAYSDKNYGRLYFLCPIKRGACCSTFVKWCDDSINESDLQPPLIKYPECECGAGVCRKVMETGEGSYGVKYFTCPIKEGHGSCGYRVSEDELLNTASIDELVNYTGIVPIRQSKQRSLNEVIEGDQTDTPVKDPANDLAEGGDLLLATKRMRITDNSENPSPVVVVSEILEGKSGGSPIEEASSQDVGFPEIEFEDDLESVNLASWAAIEAESYLLSRMSTPSQVSCRQSLFQSDTSAADASLGIFPSFDPIKVPKQTSTPNSQSECKDLAIKTPSQCTQLSRDVVSPNRSQGSDSQLKARRQREVALFTQQRLLNDLEDLDFHQHESMRETAEATFSMLNLLGFECKQFSDYVWNYINLATSMAEIDESMENSPTMEVHGKFLEEEKAKLANIKDDYKKTEALLGASNRKRNLLCEEVARLEATLLEKRNELKFCELETAKVETQLDDIKRRMLEVDITLKDKARQAEEAWTKIAVREKTQIAAMTALEKAKHELEN